MSEKTASTALQTNACQPYVWLKAMACHKTSPEDWERYLILDQVASGGFVSQPERFRQAYADLVDQLSAEEMLRPASAGLLLTEAGQDWKLAFESRHF